MEKRNLLFQLSFLIVVFLALGLAFMRISGTGIGAPSGPQPSARERTPGRFASSEAAQQALESLKNEELLGIPPSLSAGRGFSSDQKRAQAVQRYGRGTSGAGDRASYGGTGAYQSASGGYMPSGRYAGREGIAAGASSYASSGREGVYAGRTGAYRTGGQAARGASAGIAGVGRPTAKEHMSGIFAPYLNSLTKEQADSLNRQLTGLSSRVERAVLQAMLPKSRKDANIEKYLQRNSSYSASAGPFAGVMEQMSAQRAGIMKSMNSAFGQEAADEAGKVMESYQKELLAALSQPGLTQEQAAQKTREIGAKYEKELQNIGQKHALKDFEAKQMEKDNSLQESLAGAYGADFAAQAEGILSSWREKDMQLALAGLSKEEYYKQQLENQRARRKDLEKLHLQYGYPLDTLHKWENDWEEKTVNDALRDEEEGKTLPVNHHFDDKTITAVSNDLKAERNEKLELAERIYGEAGGAAVNAIYERHEARMTEIMNSDRPLSDKKKEMQQVRQETNAQINALQRSPEMRQAREREQVNTTMEQLMQDPGLANASPEQREAFEQHARPVLQDMFRRMNEIAESDLPNDEKQRQIAALQERAQRQLSGQ